MLLFHFYLILNFKLIINLLATSTFSLDRSIAAPFHCYYFDSYHLLHFSCYYFDSYHLLHFSWSTIGTAEYVPLNIFVPEYLKPEFLILFTWVLLFHVWFNNS
jgi:hypothetical protein